LNPTHINGHAFSAGSLGNDQSSEDLITADDDTVITFTGNGTPNSCEAIVFAGGVAGNVDGRTNHLSILANDVLAGGRNALDAKSDPLNP